MNQNVVQKNVGSWTLYNNTVGKSSYTDTTYAIVSELYSIQNTSSMSKKIYTTSGTTKKTSLTNVNTSEYDYFIVFVYCGSVLSSFVMQFGNNQCFTVNGTHNVTVSCPKGLNQTISIIKYDGNNINTSNPDCYFNQIIGHKATE